MNDALLNKPNDYLEFTNDSEIKVFLKELGILQKLEALSLSIPGMKCHIFVAHKTHWIVAILYCGHKNPLDNGYAVHCFPKSRYDSQEPYRFLDHLKKLLGEKPGDAGLYNNPMDKN
jgi:hypothetical protein